MHEWWSQLPNQISWMMWRQDLSKLWALWKGCDSKTAAHPNISSCFCVLIVLQYFPGLIQQGAYIAIRLFQIHDKNTPWKSFLVVVEGASKNDENHKTELPDEEYDVARSKISELSFAESGNYQNLTAIQENMTTLHENGATDCKSSDTGRPQETPVSTTLHDLSVLHTQTDSLQSPLHTLVIIE